MKTRLQSIALVALSLMFTGCVVIINNGKPSADEQKLIDIQNQSSQEVATVNQKIQSGTYTVDQVKQMMGDVQKSIEENLKKIDDLHLPERAKELADKTKQYLQDAQHTYDSLMQMAAPSANDLMNNVKTMSQPLLNMAEQMSQAQMQFVQNLQKAAQS